MADGVRLYVERVRSGPCRKTLLAELSIPRARLLQILADQNCFKALKLKVQVHWITNDPHVLYHNNVRQFEHRLSTLQRLQRAIQDTPAAQQDCREVVGLFYRDAKLGSQVKVVFFHQSHNNFVCRTLQELREYFRAQRHEAGLAEENPCLLLGTAESVPGLLQKREPEGKHGDTWSSNRQPAKASTPSPFSISSGTKTTREVAAADSAPREACQDGLEVKERVLAVQTRQSAQQRISAGMLPTNCDERSLVGAADAPLLVCQANAAPACLTLVVNFSECQQQEGQGAGNNMDDAGVPAASSLPPFNCSLPSSPFVLQRQTETATPAIPHTDACNSWQQTRKAADDKSETGGDAGLTSRQVSGAHTNRHGSMLSPKSFSRSPLQPTQSAAVRPSLQAASRVPLQLKAGIAALDTQCGVYSSLSNQGSTVVAKGSCDSLNMASCHSVQPELLQFGDQRQRGSFAKGLWKSVGRDAEASLPSPPKVQDRVAQAQAAGQAGTCGGTRAQLTDSTGRTNACKAGNSHGSVCPSALAEQQSMLQGATTTSKRYTRQFQVLAIQRQAIGSSLPTEPLKAATASLPDMQKSTHSITALPISGKERDTGGPSDRTGLGCSAGLSFKMLVAPEKQIPYTVGSRQSSRCSLVPASLDTAPTQPATTAGTSSAATSHRIAGQPTMQSQVQKPTSFQVGSTGRDRGEADSADSLSSSAVKTVELATALQPGSSSSSSLVADAEKPTTPKKATVAELMYRPALTTLKHGSLETARTAPIQAVAVHGCPADTATGPIEGRSDGDSDQGATERGAGMPYLVAATEADVHLSKHEGLAPQLTSSLGLEKPTPFTVDNTQTPLNSLDTAPAQPAVFPTTASAALHGNQTDHPAAVLDQVETPTAVADVCSRGRQRGKRQEDLEEPAGKKQRLNMELVYAHHPDTHHKSLANKVKQRLETRVYRDAEDRAKREGGRAYEQQFPVQLEIAALYVARQHLKEGRVLGRGAYGTVKLCHFVDQYGKGVPCAAKHFLRASQAKTATGAIRELANAFQQTAFVKKVRAAAGRPEDQTILPMVELLGFSVDTGDDLIILFKLMDGSLNGWLEELRPHRRLVLRTGEGIKSAPSVSAEQFGRELLFQKARALLSAHLASIVHSDLNLGNFLVFEADAALFMALGDVGLSMSTIVKTDASQSLGRQGTHIFCPPELAGAATMLHECMALGNHCQESDCWRLGGTMAVTMEFIEQVVQLPSSTCSGSLFMSNELEMFELAESLGLEADARVVEALVGLHTCMPRFTALATAELWGFLHKLFRLNSADRAKMEAFVMESQHWCLLGRALAAPFDSLLQQSFPRNNSTALWKTYVDVEGKAVESAATSLLGASLLQDVVCGTCFLWDTSLQLAPEGAATAEGALWVLSLRDDEGFTIVCRLVYGGHAERLHRLLLPVLQSKEHNEKLHTLLADKQNTVQLCALQLAVMVGQGGCAEVLLDVMHESDMPMDLLGQDMVIKADLDTLTSTYSTVSASVQSEQSCSNVHCVKPSSTVKVDSSHCSSSSQVQGTVQTVSQGDDASYTRIVELIQKLQKPAVDRQLEGVPAIAVQMPAGASHSSADAEKESVTMVVPLLYAAANHSNMDGTIMHILDYGEKVVDVNRAQQLRQAVYMLMQPSGETALFHLVRLLKLDMIHLLVQQGANLSHKSAVGLTPRTMAEQCLHVQLVRGLQRHAEQAGLPPLKVKHPAMSLLLELAS